MTVAVQPGQCVVCRLAESGVGYHPFGGRRLFKSTDVAWTCEHDLPLAKGWFQMPSAVRDKIERDALTEAAQKTGEYFERLGKTDFANFTLDEYETTFAVFLEHFGAAMRKRLGDATAPF